jgi:Leucine-rich repeat (LRR) protein
MSTHQPFQPWQRCALAFLVLLVAPGPSQAWERAPETTCYSYYLPDLETYGSLDEALKEPLEVERLELRGHDLSAVPSEIVRLENLKVLILSNNRLTELPPELSRLSQLQALSLGSNQIQRWPSVVGELSQLRALSLDSNGLEALGPEIGRLQHLRALGLSNNSLRGLVSGAGG